MTPIEKTAVEIAVAIGCITRRPVEDTYPCSTGCYCLTAARVAYESAGKFTSARMLQAGMEAQRKNMGIKEQFVAMLSAAKQDTK